MQCVSVTTGGHCLFESHPLICSDGSFNGYTLFVVSQLIASWRQMKGFIYDLGQGLLLHMLSHCCHWSKLWPADQSVNQTQLFTPCDTWDQLSTLRKTPAARWVFSCPLLVTTAGDAWDCSCWLSVTHQSGLAGWTSARGTPPPPPPPPWTVCLFSRGRRRKPSECHLS